MELALVPATLNEVTTMGKSESQMDIMEKSDNTAKKSWGAAHLLLGLITGAVVVLLILFTTSKATVCTTTGCATAAARIIENMDTSVEPCSDFYEYACGGWLKKHVMPETSYRYNVLEILRDEIRSILKGLLEMPDQDDRDAVKKAKILYKSCMNESLIEQRGSLPLLELLTVLGEWPVAHTDWNLTKEPQWNLEEKMSLLNYRFNKRVLVNMFVRTDSRNCSKNIIYIDQPSLGMPSRDYYINNGNDKQVRETYLQFMITIARMVREDKNMTRDDAFVQEEMSRVMELETEIAKATISDGEHNDVTLLYNKMTLTEFQQKFAIEGFNWTSFLQGVMSSVNIQLQPEEEVVVYGFPYLNQLKTIIPKYSASTLQNYLVWCVVIDQVNGLGRRYKDVGTNYRKALFGTTKQARWSECVNYVNSNMRSATGSMYVKETFSNESKRMISDLINKVQEALIEMLGELQWMDDVSKEKAKEKALSIKKYIGYPDYILENQNDKLDQETASLNFSDQKYFENMLEILKATAQKELEELREPVDTNAWITGSAVANAYYTRSRNLISFPAGILQPPFFSKYQPQAVNFGEIGMIIGHELTHGFDYKGRNFDKDGNMFNWWSNYSAMQFKELSECMVYQYGNYTWDLAGGQNVNGIITLGENIADNGGIRQAYKAYMKWVEKNGKEPKLPGLDFTDKQLFFLSFAQIWCGTYQPEYARQYIKTSEHTPVKYRVVGSLQNFEAFSEAFNCKKGTKMNPVKTCRVW
ncbi:membrane metallo-endopeptidase-like 1 [Gastrophryne carolinensis]